MTRELIITTRADNFNGTYSVREKLRATPNMASTTSWPRFFYPKDVYDPNDIAKGLLQGELLVCVCSTLFTHDQKLTRKKAYKFIYTGPSSWDKPDGVSHNTRYCNARLAEMQQVTCRSLAYVATQV
jgi:Family of unknown function (DUF6698)